MLKHAEYFAAMGLSPPRGMLLHGPPGTGKVCRRGRTRSPNTHRQATDRHAHAPMSMQRDDGFAGGCMVLLLRLSLRVRLLGRVS